MVTGTGQTVFASYIGTILFCLLVAVIAIAAVRYLLRRIKLWHVLLPLLVLGILLSCGSVAEAGMVGVVPVADIAIVKPLWYVVVFVVMVISIFL